MIKRQISETSYIRHIQYIFKINHTKFVLTDYGTATPGRYINNTYN